jgi:hypothetical protein
MLARATTDTYGLIHHYRILNMLYRINRTTAEARIALFFAESTKAKVLLPNRMTNMDIFFLYPI